MTNEELNEAIRYLEEERLTVEAILYGENQDKFDSTIMLINDAKFRESRKPLTIYDMAIKALEQEPCENKIIEWKKDFKGFINALSMPRDDYKGIMEYIDELPPVTPQPKTGHWTVIREEFEFMGGIVNEPRGCKCSNCNKVVRFKSDYCPNCGADMRESEGEE